MTGPEQEPTPLNMPRLEEHIQAALSAGLLTPDLTWGLFTSRRSYDHPAFRALVEELRSEPLLEALDGKIMHTGGGRGGGFSLRLLAFWLVSRSFRDGVHDALALLSTWVTQDYNEGFEIVLLSGVAVEESLSLYGGISLAPVETLPDHLLISDFRALQDARSKLDQIVVFNTPSTYILQCLLPTTALIRPMKFRPRAWDSDNPLKLKSEGPPLEHLCWCFAALEACWPQPHACYSVLADSVPAGGMLGSSHLQPQAHYGLGYAPPSLQEQDRARAERIFERFIALPDSRRERLLPALEWLSTAKRRARMEQKLVDLAIVLESLLTGEGESVEQIALALRTRGAWLLGTNYKERCEVHDLIKAVYETRSMIVHEGRIRMRKGIPQWQIKLGGRHVHRAHIIPDATRLCERVVDHMIEASTEPNWTAIVLGQDGDKND